MSFLTEQSTAAAAGKSNIARDALVRSLKTGSERDACAGIPRLRARTTRGSRPIGVEFEHTGTHQARCRQAEGGGAGQRQRGREPRSSARPAPAASSARSKAQVEDYTKAGGLVQDAKDRLKDQIVKIDSQARHDGDAARPAAGGAPAEFIAADQLMTQLNGQGSSLQALGGQYRLF